MTDDDRSEEEVFIRDRLGVEPDEQTRRIRRAQTAGLLEPEDTAELPELTEEEMLDAIVGPPTRRDRLTGDEWIET